MTKEEIKKRIRDRVKAFSTYNNVPSATDRFLNENLKVAVYAYVAASALVQVSSFELQTDRLKRQMERYPNWNLIGIYIDEGSKNRKEMNRMLEDCKAGKINLVLTKSIARFSRNASECISVVNMLRELDPPVGVLFETENIYTLDNSEWEELETLSPLAEEESLMKSFRCGERIIPGRRNGVSMSPEVKSLLGYKTTEKKEQDDGQEI